MSKTTRFVGTLARKLGLNKGAPRLWLEGSLPERAGFKPGARYSVKTDGQELRVVLKVDEKGVRLVSSKTKADRTLPVIDLNSKELLDRFAGMEAVRVVLMDGEIHVLPDAVEVKKADRRNRLQAMKELGVVTIGSVSHGVGVLSNAIHSGLRKMGLTPKLAWACDISEEILDQAAYANEVWDEDTVALAMPIQQLAFMDEYTISRLSRPILLEGGLPCVAASTAGRAKKGLAMPEHDENAGHLIAAFIALVARVNPAAILLENVTQYFNTASASILRTQLKELGYTVHEKVIAGADYAIEARVRQVLVAVTEGIDLDLESMIAPPREKQTVGSILDDVAEDDPCWSEMKYLKEKEVRDKAAGKGFAMAIASMEDTTVGTLGAGYAKVRSTEVKIPHPSNPDLLRQLSPEEHARVKGIPQHLLKDVTSKTFAHMVLGNSCVWPAFEHLGEVLGRALLNCLPQPKEIAPAANDGPLFQAA